ASRGARCDPRDHAAARAARGLLPPVVRPRDPAARPRVAGRRRVYVPARECAALPRSRDARRPARRKRVRPHSIPPLCRGYRGTTRGRGRVSALGAIREAPGLEEYLDALEERLARNVASHPGLVAAVGNEALAAGGKRLRPLLVFLSTPPGR